MPLVADRTVHLYHCLEFGLFRLYTIVERTGVLTGKLMTKARHLLLYLFTCQANRTFLNQDVPICLRFLTDSHRLRRGSYDNTDAHLSVINMRLFLRRRTSAITLYF